MSSATVLFQEIDNVMKQINAIYASLGTNAENVALVDSVQDDETMTADAALLDFVKMFATFRTGVNTNPYTSTISTSDENFTYELMLKVTPQH